MSSAVCCAWAFAAHADESRTVRVRASLPVSETLRNAAGWASTGRSASAPPSSSPLSKCGGHVDLNATDLGLRTPGHRLADQRGEGGLRGLKSPMTAAEIKPGSGGACLGAGATEGEFAPISALMGSACC